MRIRSQIQIGEMQFHCMPGKGTADAIFIVGQMLCHAYTAGDYKTILNGSKVRFDCSGPSRAGYFMNSLVARTP